MNKSEMKIHPDQKMSDLTVKYPNVLLVLERMNIPFGFGEQSIMSIAKRYAIDPDVFLIILQISCGEYHSNVILSNKGIKDLLNFLKASHKHIKEQQIPDLRNLIAFFSEGLSTKGGSILVSFFDGYITEVNEHFRYEEEVVFPYTDSLLSENLKSKYEIKEFEKNHSDIEQKLLDLKNILVKYIPEEGNSEYRRKILKELSALEEDINCHNILEDYVLIPSVKQLEKGKHV